MSNCTHPPTFSPAELRECEKSGHHPPPPMITSTRNVQVFMHARALLSAVRDQSFAEESKCAIVWYKNLTVLIEISFGYM